MSVKPGQAHRDDNQNLYVTTAAGENVVRLSALEAGRPSRFS